MRRENHPRVVAALGLAAAFWLLLVAVSGADQSALYFLPVVLLVVPLALGRYLGEDTLERLLTRPRRRRPPVTSTPRPAERQFQRSRPIRGGALLATRLAGRAPPVAA